MDNWDQQPDMSDLDAKLTNARMRQPARLLLIGGGDVAKLLEAGQLATLPEVTPTLMAQARKRIARQMQAEILYAEVNPITASAISSQARARRLARDVNGDSRPSVIAPRSVSAATARKAGARPRRPRMTADQQRTLIAAWKSGTPLAGLRVLVASGYTADLTKPVTLPLTLLASQVSAARRNAERRRLIERRLSKGR